MMLRMAIDPDGMRAFWWAYVIWEFVDVDLLFDVCSHFMK
jgi:hypothetical protein